MTRRRAWLGRAWLGLVLWTALGGSVAAEPGPSSFSTFGYEVTGGAAPGYVEDAACTICHREIAESYAEVGMARSFAAPENAHVVETFTDEPFYHDDSDRFYRMRRSEDGALTFERWQVDEKGRKINAFTADVADQLLPHQEADSPQEFFCLFYSGRTDEAWALLRGPQLEDTELYARYRQTLD